MGLKIVPGIFKKIPLLTSPAFSGSVCKERDSILFIQYPVLVGRPSHPKRSGTCFFSGINDSRCLPSATS